MITLPFFVYINGKLVTVSKNIGRITQDSYMACEVLIYDGR